MFTTLPKNEYKNIVKSVKTFTDLISLFPETAVVIKFVEMIHKSQAMQMLSIEEDEKFIKIVFDISWESVYLTITFHKTTKKIDSVIITNERCRIYEEKDVYEATLTLEQTYGYNK
jgi:predicted protein tyrosine phosphatase